MDLGFGEHGWYRDPSRWRARFVAIGLSQSIRRSVRKASVVRKETRPCLRETPSMRHYGCFRWNGWRHFTGIEEGYVCLGVIGFRGHESLPHVRSVRDSTKVLAPAVEKDGEGQ